MSNPADRVEIITSVQRPRASLRLGESPAGHHRVAVRQRQLLPRRRDTRLRSRHRSRTENHADRKSIEQWNGRSTSSARSSVLCARQSLPGCRHRHAPAIGLELLSLLPPRDAAGAEWGRQRSGAGSYTSSSRPTPGGARR